MDNFEAIHERNRHDRRLPFPRKGMEKRNENDKDNLYNIHYAMFHRTEWEQKITM